MPFAFILSGEDTVVAPHNTRHKNKYENVWTRQSEATMGMIPSEECHPIIRVQKKDTTAVITHIGQTAVSQQYCCT